MPRIKPRHFYLNEIWSSRLFSPYLCCYQRDNSIHRRGFTQTDIEWNETCEHIRKQLVGRLPWKVLAFTVVRPRLFVFLPLMLIAVFCSDVQMSKPALGSVRMLQKLVQQICVQRLGLQNLGSIRLST